jgi:hypothetical protein
MNKNYALTAIICVFILQTGAAAQSQDPPKFEVAAEFASLGRDGFSGERADAGLGGRFTFNLNRVVSLEAAGYYFPKSCFDCRNNGRMTEAVGGVKVGKRFNSWGIFAKARPGVVSFSEGEFNVLRVPPGPSFAIDFERNRVTSFAADLGGVVEFYPSKRIVTRFDLGDTIIHFKQRTTNGLSFDPATQTFSLFPILSPARTTNHFQFMASVGFRF